MGGEVFDKRPVSETVIGNPRTRIFEGQKMSQKQNQERQYWKKATTEPEKTYVNRRGQTITGRDGRWLTKEEAVQAEKEQPGCIAWPPGPMPWEPWDFLPDDPKPSEAGKPTKEGVESD